MEPMQVNALDFESSEKPLRAFFRANSGKLPDGINFNINYNSSNGKIAIVVWSFQSDPKHIEGAVRKMEKNFNLPVFGPLKENGRDTTYYSSKSEMSIDDFVGFLAAIQPKDSAKLIESVKNDYKAMETDRKKQQQNKKEEEKNTLPNEVLNGLNDKFADVEKEMKSLYPSGNTRLDSKAYERFSDANLELRSGAKLDTILEKVKQAVTAFDEEEKDKVKEETVGKIKMKLVGLQGALENAMKTPVEGKGQPPRPVELGKQLQPIRP